MQEPNFVLLYVDSPAVSAKFYGGLLGREPVESSSTFALFALSSGVKLGLWSRHTVQPSAAMGGAGGELAFSVSGIDEVNRLFSDWTGRKLPILQEPTEMDFGFTFVATDPDGHRLRVFAPSEGE